MRLPAVAPPMVTGAEPPAWFPWAGAAMGVLLGLVGLVLLLRVVPRLRRARTSTGTLVHVTTVPSGHDMRRMWRLTVEYVDHDGVVRQGVWTGYSSLDWTVYRPGMRVPVRYDPVSGTVVDLPGGYRPPAPLIPAFLAVFGPLFAVAFWWMTS